MKSHTFHLDATLLEEAMVRKVRKLVDLEEDKILDIVQILTRDRNELERSFHASDAWSSIFIRTLLQSEIVQSLRRRLLRGNPTLLTYTVKLLAQLLAQSSAEAGSQVHEDYDTRNMSIKVRSIKLLISELRNIYTTIEKVGRYSELLASLSPAGGQLICEVENPIILSSIDDTKIQLLEQVHALFRMLLSADAFYASYMSGRRFMIDKMSNFSDIARLAYSEYLLPESLRVVRMLSYRSRAYVRRGSAIDVVYVDTSGSTGIYLRDRYAIIAVITAVALYLYHKYRCRVKIFSDRIVEVEPRYIVDTLLRARPSFGTNIEGVIRDIEKNRYKTPTIISDFEFPTDVFDQAKNIDTTILCLVVSPYAKRIVEELHKYRNLKAYPIEKSTDITKIVL